jgi:ribosome biogenesis GTPase
VAVGDRVSVHIENNEGVIDGILQRENVIIRKSVKKTSHGHVIAANVDQVLLVATMARPRTSTGFIDRLFVAAESFRIPQILLFNKKDLLDADSKRKQEELIDTYENIGVTCKSVCALNDDQHEIKELLYNKITLIAGHSGVGKSTLINKISPGIEQRTAEISDFSEKGTHATTFAEMFQIDDRTFIIDTPGIKEFGLVDMSDQEISDYFQEMRDLRLNCKLGSKCIHINEPKCAIVDAVKNGAIALSRYESYLSMIIDEDNRR